MTPARPLVLLVNDEPGGCAHLEMLLEQAGYRVESAADGAAGRARVARGDIDLVLLERRLPDGDGLTLCAWVRAHEGPVYLPIIVLGVSASPVESHAGFVAGADNYLTKPFQAEDVHDRVAACLRMRQHSKVSHEQQGKQRAEAQQTLVLTVSTSLELLRLLIRLLDEADLQGIRHYSPQDLVRWRVQLHAAVSRLTAQIDSATRSVYSRRPRSQD
jgi:DNA-binding response OmpR family regulator